MTMWNMLRERSPVALPADPTEILTTAAQRAIAFLAPRVGAFVANIAATAGSLFVMLFAMFFLLRDSHSFADRLRRLLPFEEEERERLITETRDLVIASVGAGLTVAATQGFIGGIAFWVLGVGGAAAWGVVMAMCALIPVVGAALVWAPVAVWWLLTGDVVRGLALAGVGAGVIGMTDNVLRPLLLSGRTSANGLVIFLGLLGGVSAFGFVGLVVGPIILVTAGSLIDALTRRAAPSRVPME
jgi:predicted PurR-regulated permease PerM